MRYTPGFRVQGMLGGGQTRSHDAFNFLGLKAQFCLDVVRGPLRICLTQRMIQELGSRVCL